MGHHFYRDEKEILYLQPSGEYDTLSPFKFCANELVRINDSLKQGAVIKIVSSDSDANTYVIQTPTEFKKWVTDVFKGGFEKYLETGID